MWQLGDKMKKILVLVLVLVSCNKEKSHQSFNIPVFDSKQAFIYLEEQCDFGPRHPGSTGHEKMKVFLEDFLQPLSDSLIVMYEEAKNTAAVIGFNYPESNWYKLSYDLIENKKKKSLIDKFKLNF